MNPRPKHLCGQNYSVTACGLHNTVHVINVTTKTEEVVCKKCKGTHWFKNLINPDKRENKEQENGSKFL